MKCLNVINIIVIFLSIIHENYAVFDPSKIPTKPPPTRENLTGNPNANGGTKESKGKKEVIVREKLPWVQNEPIARSGNTRLISSPGYSDNAQSHADPVIDNHARASHARKDSNLQNANSNSKSESINPSQPCPDKSAGQYPYPADCRKFYNCWNGKGHLQMCAPGTLFNPNTLQCDYPYNVKCLPKDEFKPVPIIADNAPHLSEPAGSETDKRPRQFFNSQIQNPPVIEQQHSGVQPPNQYYHSHLPKNTDLYQETQRYPGVVQPYPGEHHNQNHPYRHHHHNHPHPHHHHQGSQSQDKQAPNSEATHYLAPDSPPYSQSSQNQNISSWNWLLSQSPRSPAPNNGPSFLPGNQQSSAPPGNPIYYAPSSNQYPVNPQQSTPYNPNSNPSNPTSYQPISNQTLVNYYPQTNYQYPSPSHPASANINPNYSNSKPGQQTSNSPSSPFNKPPQQNYPVYSSGSYNPSGYTIPTYQNTAAAEDPSPGNVQPNGHQHNPNTYNNQQIPESYPHIPNNSPSYGSYNPDSKAYDSAPSLNIQPNPYISTSFTPGGNSGQFASSANNPGSLGNPNSPTTNFQSGVDNNQFGSNSHPHQSDEDPPGFSNQNENEDGSVRCPNEFSGLLPHPSECSKFLNCDRGRTFIQHCASGTVFNPMLSVCDFQHAVKCGGRKMNNDDDQEQESSITQPVWTKVCKDYEFRCKDSMCIELTRVCDGYHDCPDKSDESDCPLGNLSNDPNNYVEKIDMRAAPNSLPQTAFSKNPTGDKSNNAPVNATEKKTDRPIYSIPRPTRKPEIDTGTQNTPSHQNPNFRHPKQPGFYIVENETSAKPPTESSDENVSTDQSAEIPPPLPKALSHTAKATITKPPVSRQLVRLRGGPKPYEGFLELQISTPGWGIVCDKENSWTIKEADIVCKQLGYARGADSTWQGRPSEGELVSLKTIAADVVECTGKESSIIDCHLEKENTCDPERDSVWIRCKPNSLSNCQPGETHFDGNCYRLVVPKEDKRDETVGFSQGEALAHCQSSGGHLLDINSKKENDYISEWLLGEKEATNVMTAGVGVSFMGRSLWLWEGSADPLEYFNWWPGWGQTRAAPPKTHTGRGLCVVAKHMFPCPGSSSTNKEETQLCDAEHYYWDAEDCGLMSGKHPYVCERKANDIGCTVGDGKQYRGSANVTESGSLCLAWDNPLVLPALQFRISESARLSILSKHNQCRNVEGSDNMPWCYVRTATGIRKEFCDIPPCADQGPTAKSINVTQFKCKPDYFSCGSKECIPRTFVCDGQPDCKNGFDEVNCPGDLRSFKHFPHSRLIGHDREKWLHTSDVNCAKQCLDAKDFICRSFSHNSKNQTCFLSDSNIGLSGHLSSNDENWHFYEVKSLSIDCNSKFVCGNNKCINTTQVCDGHNDCGDRSDESYCPVIDEGFEIRLVGGKRPSEGLIEVKVMGHWGSVCADEFGLRDANVVCREVGYTMGAHEVKPRSAFNTKASNATIFLMDDLECRGNESSIRECEFSGWGVHNCGQEEAVGVICQDPGKTCPANHWRCPGSESCIPVMFVCNNVQDCRHGTDEAPELCNTKTEIRLVGNEKNNNPNVMAGRVEIKKFGMWGTICDDDFGVSEAEVICKSLGFHGNAEFRKEAYFGAGEGIIWLDQVHCNGSENNVDLCFHHKWGETNCKHNEDVSVICSKQSTNDLQTRKSPAQSPDDNFIQDEILPFECGTIDENLDVLSTDFTAKVVAGFETQKGTYPWQASIRARISFKSVHWCGGVIISSLHILTAGHCVRSYTKDVYFVRVGDHDTEADEGTEQEAEIDEIYIHEEFNHGQNLNNDIALIKLKGRGLKLNTWVRPICLPPPGVSYRPGHNCTISGWGSNGAYGSGYSYQLRSTWVPILNHNECTAPYVYGDNAISNGMFCAGNLEGGPDSCQGDSGGPFACEHKGRFTLFGVISWGHSCGRPNKPGVYTKVLYYMDWIHAKLHESLFL